MTDEHLFLPFLLSKEQLRRVHMLAKEGDSILRALRFLKNEVGEGSLPQSFENLLDSAMSAFGTSDGGSRDDPSLPAIVRHAVENYRHFIAALGDTLLPATRGRLCGDAHLAISTRLKQKSRLAQIQAFLVYHMKTGEQLSDLLEILLRTRNRFVQEMEQYPSHHRIPPRYQGRESTATLRFLHQLVEAYDEGVRHIITGLLPSSSPGMQFSSTISLTFEYIGASTVRWRATRNRDDKKRPVHLLIESPYYYLDAPKNASVLAHEVAHAYVNTTLFGEDRREYYNSLVLDAVDTMHQFVTLHLSGKGLLGMAPRLAEGIITESIADVVALLVAGPYYALSFLNSVVDAGDLRMRIGPAPNKFLRLQIVVELAQWLRQTVGEGGLGGEVAAADDDLRAIGRLLDQIRTICLRADRTVSEVPMSGDVRHTAEAVFFHETLKNYLLDGLRKIASEIASSHKNAAESGPFLFLCPRRESEDWRGARAWLGELVSFTRERFDRCGAEDTAALNPPPGKDLSGVVAQQLLRLLPDLLWRESTSWHRRALHREIPTDLAPFSRPV